VGSNDPGIDEIPGVVGTPDGIDTSLLLNLTNCVIPIITAINRRIAVNTIITRERVLVNSDFRFSFLPAI
jgi:hypothetical protein